MDNNFIKDTASIVNNESLEATHNKGEVISICFDYKTKAFFAFLITYLLLTTCFNINGSSIGIIDNYFGINSRPQILFGTPKAIRSDEWSLHTPAVISQHNSTKPYSMENYSLGGYKSPLVMNVPVQHFSSFLRPQHWLFFVTEIEKAYAFYWNFKLVILMLGIFLLLMLLLENNFWLSIFGAIWIYFSSYLQWWYSSPQMWPELIGFFGLFTSSFIISLTSKLKKNIVVSSLVFIVSFFNFTITLYPPHQIPLIYLSGFIILGVLLPRLKSILSELLANRFRLICIIASLLLTFGLLYMWFCDTSQTLEVFANTIYPGQRRTLGGGMSIAEIFNGFLGVFMNEFKTPKISGGVRNICESSNFFLLFPLPIMLMCWKKFNNIKISTLETSFVIYISILLVWQIWGFPKSVAQLTLFDRVIEKRTLLPLGIASILWTCLSLHNLLKEKIFFTWKFRCIIAALMLVLAISHSLYFNVITDDFATPYQIIIVCLFVFVVSLLFLSRQTKFFAGLILLPNIFFHGLINPICVGLESVLDNPLYKEIYQITHEARDAKWIIFGEDSNITASLAYAAGANVFNGLKYIPNIEEMKKLSTKTSDSEIYNRYGYIVLTSNEGAEINFSLSSQPDLYRISVNPYNNCWNKLGITNAIIKSNYGNSIINLTK